MLFQCEYNTIVKLLLFVKILIIKKVTIFYILENIDIIYKLNINVYLDNNWQI